MRSSWIEAHRSCVQPAHTGALSMHACGCPLEHADAMRGAVAPSLRCPARFAGSVGHGGACGEGTCEDWLPTVHDPTLEWAGPFPDFRSRGGRGRYLAGRSL